MTLGHVQDIWARSWPALAFRSSCYVVVVAADRRTTLQVRAPDIEQLNGAEQGLRGTLCKNIRSTLEAERVARISQEQQVAAQGVELLSGWAAGHFLHARGVDDGAVSEHPGR